jgi:hypothetical protein
MVGRTKAAIRAKRRSTYWNSLTSLVSIGLTFVVLYIFRDRDKQVLVLSGGLGFALISGLSIVNFVLYDYLLKKRIRKWLLDVYGPTMRRIINFELSENGIGFESDGTMVQIEWRKFTGLKQNDDDTELYWGTDSMSILPNTIFESEEQKNEWLNFIREKIELSSIQNR